MQKITLITWLCLCVGLTLSVCPSRITQVQEQPKLVDKVSQSSTSHDRVAERARDGNKNRTLDGNSCTHTNEEKDPWWRWDFDGTKLVSAVTITNRDEYQERLTPVKVYILDDENNKTLCNSFDGDAGAEIAITCRNSIMGSSLIIQLTGDKRILTLCEVELGAVTQSSTSHDHVAKRAIDGDKNSDLGGNSCTHTNTEKNPWWRWDFDSVKLVSGVILTNRDGFYSRLIPVSVHVIRGVSRSLCTVYRGKAVATLDLTCDQAWYGASIEIGLPGEDRILTLCEVEVKEKNTDKFVTGTSQSSTYAGSYPGGCKETNNETDPWWRWDFAEYKRVSAVTIKQIKDLHRLSPVNVYVIDDDDQSILCNSFDGVPGIKIAITCNIPIDGKSLIIQLPGEKRILSFCELLLGAVSQSSTYQGRDADRATDDNRIGAGTLCTHTNREKDPWWRMDFSEPMLVERVQLFNRDEYSDRLNSVRLYVLDGALETFCEELSGEAGVTVMLTCDPVVRGSALEIRLPGDDRILTLCEVEEYGVEEYGLEEEVDVYML